MKTKPAAIFLMMVLMSSWMPVDAKTVESRGDRSCGVWITEGKAGTSARVITEAWLVGFLTGLVVATGIDALRGTDNESLYLWMDNFCQREPLKNIAHGGAELFNKLRMEKGL